MPYVIYDTWGFGFIANTALSFASCCINNSTTPLVPYITYSIVVEILVFFFSSFRWIEDTFMVRTTCISQQRISLWQYIETKYDVETAHLVRRHHGVFQKLARYKNNA